MSCFGSDSSYLMEALLLNSSAIKRRRSQQQHPQSPERIKKKKDSRGLAKWIKKIPCVMMETSPERSPSPADSLEAVRLLASPDISPEKVFLVPLLPLDEDVIELVLWDLEKRSRTINVRQCYDQLFALQRTSGGTDTWTSKYAPQESFSLLGNETALLKLKSWLNDWKLYIEKNDTDDVAESTAAKKAEKRAKKAKETAASRKRRREAGTDSDSEEEEEYCIPAPEEMPVTGFMVYGPPGVGKTAAVHALARELGFTVLEINPASSKDAKQILLQSLEATQSHRMHVKSANPLAQFLSHSHSKSEEKRANTLILIDDADVLPEGEESFIMALESMLKKTKRPVIFTISGLSKLSLINLDSFEVGDLDFVRQPLVDLSCYVSLVALAESVVIGYEDAFSIVQTANGDLRASINLVQFWWAGRASSPISQSQDVFVTLPARRTLVFPDCSALIGDSTHERDTLPEVVLLVNEILNSVCMGAESVDYAKIESDSGIGSQCSPIDGLRNRTSPEISNHGVKRRLDDLSHDFRREVRDAEMRSALVNLTLVQVDSSCLSSSLPLAGVCEEVFEESPTNECRFTSFERSAEVCRDYENELRSIGPAWPTAFSSINPDAVRSGRYFFHRYGQFNPQVHVRGRQFGCDHWSFVRTMAESERQRRESEERVKRRRLRFYHYLGSLSLNLSDELIGELAYRIGHSLPKKEQFPASL